MSVENLLTADEIAAAKLADLDDEDTDALGEIAGEADDDEGDEKEDGADEKEGEKDEKGDEKDEDDGAEDEDDSEDEGEKDEAGDDKPADDKSEKPEDEDDEDDERPDAESTFAARLDAGDPAALEQHLKGVKEKIVALRKQWRSGDLDDDQYDEKLDELESERDQAVANLAAAKTAAAITEQTAQQAFERDLQNFLRNSERYEGVPYVSNRTLAHSFQQELKAVAQAFAKDNPNASAQELFDAAHDRVMDNMKALGVTFGKKKAAEPEPKPEPKPEAKKPEPKAEEKPKEPRKVPKTLGGLPNAAPAGGVEDEVTAKIATLDGEDLERYIAGLPAAKRRELDSRD